MGESEELKRRGDELAAKREYYAAAESYIAAIQADRRNTDAWHELGALYRMGGREPEATKCFDAEAKLLAEKANLPQVPALEETVKKHKRLNKWVTTFGFLVGWGVLGSILNTYLTFLFGFVAASIIVAAAIYVHCQWQSRKVTVEFSALEYVVAGILIVVGFISGIWITYFLALVILALAVGYLVKFNEQLDMSPTT